MPRIPVKDAQDAAFQVQSPNISSFRGAGEGLQNLSNTLSALAAQQKRAAEIAAAERERAAAVAAKLRQDRLDANILTGEEGLVARGQAADLTRRTLEEDTSNPGFAAATGQSYEKAIEESLRRAEEGGASPDALLKLGGILDDQYTQTFKKSLVITARAMRAKADAALEGRGNELVQMVRDSPVSTQLALDAVERAVTRYQAVLEPNDLAKWRTEQRQNIVVAQVRGLLDDGDIPAARAAIADPAFRKDLDPATREGLIKELAADIDRNDSARKASAKQRIADIVGLVNAGGSPSDALIQQAAAAAAGDPDLLNDLKLALGGAAFGRQLNGLSLPALQSAVLSLQEPTTQAELTMLTIAKAKFEETRTGLETDGLGLYFRQFPGEFSVLNPADPASVEKRVMSVRLASQRYGRDLDAMTVEEINAYRGQFEAAAPPGQLAILMQLGGMDLPSDMESKLLGAIGKNAPLMGLVLDLTKNPEREVVNTAFAVLQGLDLIRKDKDADPARQLQQKDDTSPDDVLVDVLGNALKDDFSNEGRRAIGDAARALYAFRNRQSKREFFDSDAQDEYQAAIRDVIGEVVERHEQNLILPLGLDEKTFNVTMRDIDVVAMHPALVDRPAWLGVDGWVQATDSDLRGARLVNSGEIGKYFVERPAAGGFERAYTGNGEAYLLDLSLATNQRELTMQDLVTMTSPR